MYGLAGRERTVEGGVVAGAGRTVVDQVRLTVDGDPAVEVYARVQALHQQTRAP